MKRMPRAAAWSPPPPMEQPVWFQQSHTTINDLSRAQIRKVFFGTFSLRRPSASYIRRTLRSALQTPLRLVPHHGGAQHAIPLVAVVRQDVTEPRAANRPRGCHSYVS